MTIDQVVELGRGATLIALKVGAPLLLIAVGVGLLVSILQAATQVQDQSLSIVPKIAAVLLAGMLLLPWMLSELVSYSSELWIGIPGRF